MFSHTSLDGVGIKHSLTNLTGDILSAQACHNLITQFQHSSRTIAQEELSIANHEVTTGIGTGEIVFKTRIASGFDTFQQSQVALNEWGGTDGCERLAVCMMLEYKSAKALMAVEVCCSRHASRQIEQLGIFVFMIFK